VRAAALEALAKRGDPAVLDTVSLCMADKKEAVEYTAAATVLRLTAIKESGAAVKKKGLGKKSKKEIRKRARCGIPPLASRVGNLFSTAFAPAELETTEAAASLAYVGAG
jgi:hypothetical protein